MKLSETEGEVLYRFNQPNGIWFEFAYVKSRQRFLAFCCNAFAEDPDWEEMDASSIAEAKKAVFDWVKRNRPSALTPSEYESKSRTTHQNHPTAW